MFVRQVQPSIRAAPVFGASNDNGIPRRRSLKPARPGAGGIVSVATEIAGTIALFYLADGVFRISRFDGASA